jgi:hypothetical protein
MRAQTRKHKHTQWLHKIGVSAGTVIAMEFLIRIGGFHIDNLSTVFIGLALL